MSVKIMGQVWDLDLPANKLLVLLAMTDHADHNGENIHPSMELVAWKTGYSERQVRRIVQGLVKDKILSAEKRPGKTTLFTAHIENGKKKEPFKRSSTVGQNVTPDIAVSDQVGHNDVRTTPDTQMSDEPSLEPSINQSIAPKSKQRPLFDLVALKSFNLQKINGDKELGARIGKIESWLKKRNTTVEQLDAFYRWYDKKTDKSARPRDVGKFAEWFTQFETLPAPTKIIPLTLTDEDYPDTADYVNLAGVSNVG